MSEVSHQRPILLGLQILVVENDASARAIAALVLETYGASVIAASSAKEGLAIVQQVQPDLLLSDIKMPHEDGYWLIQQIRQLDSEQGGKTPAIAMTANPLSLSREQALQSGFQRYIIKPFSQTDLITAISSVMQ
jgi:CheY-like chemotaxis protein